MENSYQYFKRDLSWLSFNYRVLLEAEDDTLPIYERIKFLSIYSSNLEEFYARMFTYTRMRSRNLSMKSLSIISLMRRFSHSCRRS